MLQTKHPFGINLEKLALVTLKRSPIRRRGGWGRWFTDAWKITLLSGQVIFVRINQRYCRIDLNPNDFASLITVRKFLAAISNVPTAVTILRIHFNVDVAGISPYWAMQRLTVPASRLYRRFGYEITSTSKAEFTIYFGSSELEQIVVYNPLHRNGKKGLALRCEARLNIAKFRRRILIPNTSLMTGPDSWARMSPFQNVKIKSVRVPPGLKPQKIMQIDHYVALTRTMTPKEALQCLREMHPAFHRMKRLIDSCTKTTVIAFDPCFRHRVSAFLKAPVPRSEQQMLNRLSSSPVKRGAI